MLRFFRFRMGKSNIFDVDEEFGMMGPFDSPHSKLVGFLTRDGRQLYNLFKSNGVDVRRTYSEFISYEDEDGGLSRTPTYVLDAMAISDKEVVVVEVNPTLSTKNTDDLIGKLQDFKKVCHVYADRVVYGAVAYVNVVKGADVYSENKGLFLIKFKSQISSIVNNKNFKPKEYCVNPA